jgi:flagellar protein FlaJ
MSKFERLGWLMPGGYRRSFERMLIYAGDDRTAERVLGKSMFLGMVLSLLTVIGLVLLQPLLLRNENVILTIIDDPSIDNLFSIINSEENVVPFWGSVATGVAMFFFFQAFVYMRTYFRMLKRASEIDKYVPDMLQLLAANIRAGMTPFQALRFSAKDEFGDLKKEVERAISKTLGTGSFSDALLGIRERVNSKTLERSIQLFVTSMRSGARMAKILEESANDLTETRGLKRELVTNTKMYTMFIFFTVLLGTPTLLTISIRFLKMITEIQTKSAVSSNVGFGMSFLVGNISITPEFLFYIAIVMLIATSFSAGCLIGVINEGKIKYGLKYVPIIAILSLLFFILSGYGIEMSGLF